MDCLHGLFKTCFLANLDLVCEARLKENVSLSLQPKLTGLPLFGGVDTETGCNFAVSAFDQALAKKECVWAFKMVGAATRDNITCACLKVMQVMQSIGDGDEETVLLHHAVQTANNNEVHCLNQAGYDAQHLQAILLVKEQEERVT
jgi:hypothetical protein